VREPRKGDPLPRSSPWRELWQAAVRKYRFLSPLYAEESAGQVVARWAPPPRVDARITGGSGSAYSWEEVAFDGGPWLTVPGGRTGTLDAYEMNQSATVAAGSVVDLRYTPAGDWRFARLGTPGDECDPCLPATDTLQLAVTYYRGKPGSRTGPFTDTYTMTRVSGTDTGLYLSGIVGAPRAKYGVVWRSECFRVTDLYDFFGQQCVSSNYANTAVELYCEVGVLGGLAFLVYDQTHAYSVTLGQPCPDSPPIGCDNYPDNLRLSTDPEFVGPAWGAVGTTGSISYLSASWTGGLGGLYEIDHDAVDCDPYHLPIVTTSTGFDPYGGRRFAITEGP
jgi:hypothetical protein